MKEVTETVLGHILAAHPSAKIEAREGQRFVLIPMYDIETDKAWIEERRIVADPVETPVGIVPVFNLRKGPNFNPNGEAKVSPLGHLYRIIGYTPPPKDDAD